MTKELKKLRSEIIKLSHQKKSGHIPSAFSILEALEALYGNVLIDGDEFILSKGHGSLALYAILMRYGHITYEEFLSYAEFNSNLGGHPDRNKIKKVFASTGSLGHGLPIAVGVALSRKIQNKPGKIYCLVGDGECNEGTVWESAMLASKLKLDNLICIVDFNNSQIRSLPLEQIESKFVSFGWESSFVEDGHNVDNIALSLKEKSSKPLCVVLRTIKGYGLESLQNDMFSWHHRSPNDEELIRFLREIEAE